MFLFKGSEIDVDCLKHMIEVDLIELIPKLNLRIKFRARLAEWKRNSIPEVSHIVNQAKSLATSCSNVIKNIDILQVLLSTEVGRSAIDHYKREASLDENQRRKVIKAVVEYFIQREVALGTKDCNTLADKIVQLFPNEVKVKNIFSFEIHISIEPISNVDKLLYTCCCRRQRKGIVIR